jgi:hypothetical protein
MVSWELPPLKEGEKPVVYNPPSIKENKSREIAERLRLKEFWFLTPQDQEQDQIGELPERFLKFDEKTADDLSTLSPSTEVVTFLPEQFMDVLVCFFY